MFLAKNILAALLLPPAAPALLVLYGLWLARNESRCWRDAGLTLAAAFHGKPPPRRAHWLPAPSALQRSTIMLYERLGFFINQLTLNAKP